MEWYFDLGYTTHPDHIPREEWYRQPNMPHTWHYMTNTRIHPPASRPKDGPRHWNPGRTPPLTYSANYESATWNLQNTPDNRFYPTKKYATHTTISPHHHVLQLSQALQILQTLQILQIWTILQLLQTLQEECLHLSIWLIANRQPRIYKTP